MAIGINWAEIWAPIWGPVWAQTVAPPEPEPESTLKPAGRPRRKRRYFVEIDGQEFDVSGPEEAEALLEKARKIAVEVIEKARSSIVVKPGLRVPSIRTPNKQLVQVVKQARQEIRDLYADASRDLEIKYWMVKAEEEEEEAIIRLLM